jgi:integrase
MANLTALKAKNLRTPGRHADGKGLFLHIRESGAKAWMVRIQVDGKRRDFGLGSFDNVPLADAREKAEDLRRQYRKGIDPVAAKKTAKTEANPIPTFEAAAKLAHGEQKTAWRNIKHRAQWLSTLQTYVFPFIGELPVDQISAGAIRDLLAKIWLTKPETARRVRQRIGTVLDWAYAKEYRTAEAPMRSISKGLPRQPKKDSHHQALPYEQVPDLVAKLAETSSVGRLALRFAILTAARSGEVRLATWQEIDLEDKRWTVPGSRMKAGKTHIVPLSEPALSILETIKTAYGNEADAFIFPGHKAKALSDMTLLKALRDNWAGEFTVHGFRSSFRDWAAEQTEFAGDVVETALAHAIANRVEAAYRRTNYLEKRRILMNDWAKFISGSPESRIGRAS